MVKDCPIDEDVVKKAHAIMMEIVDDIEDNTRGYFRRGMNAIAKAIMEERRANESELPDPSSAARHTPDRQKKYL